MRSRLAQKRLVDQVTTHSKVVLLVGTSSGVAAGIALKLAGENSPSDLVLALATTSGLVPLVGSVVGGLLKRKAGVDVIALLAMAGALALGEYLAGAIIALMLATGGALEDYAAKRAQRELTSLL
jgi:cation transport ATPase